MYGIAIQFLFFSLGIWHTPSPQSILQMHFRLLVMIIAGWFIESNLPIILQDFRVKSLLIVRLKSTSKGMRDSIFYKIKTRIHHKWLCQAIDLLIMYYDHNGGSLCWCKHLFVRCKETGHKSIKREREEVFKQSVDRPNAIDNLTFLETNYE